MMFENRKNAAILLLERLKKYKGENVVVAGIPRGAIPMAKIIADGLGAKLTAVLVHKIPAPFNVELAIGCIGLSGRVQLLSYFEGASQSYIDAKAKEQLEKLRKRQETYALEEPEFSGKTVIIVDDGIATGATTMCAVNEVRGYSPDKIVLATPVSSPDAADALRPLVDEFVCLYLPLDMFSISQFYNSFPQVSDDEVIELLHRRGSPHEDLSLW